MNTNKNSTEKVDLTHEQFIELSNKIADSVNIPRYNEEYLDQIIDYADLTTKHLGEDSDSWEFFAGLMFARMSFDQRQGIIEELKNWSEDNNKSKDDEINEQENSPHK